MLYFSRFVRFLRRFPDASALALLFGVAAGVFWPLLTGRAYFLGDLELYFYPLGEFWHRELQNGRLPLWNPHLFGGASFVGNPQMSLFYLPSLLLWFFPPVQAFSVGAVLHLWGSAVVLFLWLRRGKTQMGVMAAFLGAICWMLCGVFAPRAQFPNMLAALAWLPAVLWCSENLARRTDARAALFLGVALGLQLQASHAQISLYTLYLAVLLALWHWKTAENRVSPNRVSPNRILSNYLSLGRLAAFFAAALGLAALLDAAQLLPVLETLRGTQRQTISLETAPRFYLPPWAISNLVAPYLYGNPNHGTWTSLGGGNFWDSACYVGIVPFGLTIWSLRKPRADGLFRFWALVALGGIFLALGPFGGLYTLAYYAVPGVSRFHDAGRFLMATGLAFSILAAWGMQSLRQSRLRRFSGLFLALSILDLAVFARTIYPLRDATQIAPQNPAPWAGDWAVETQNARIWSHEPLAAGSFLLSYHDYRPRTPARDAALPLGLIPNLHIWHGALEAGGYDPITSRLAARRLETLQIAPGATRFPPDYAQKLGADSIRFLSLARVKPLPSTPQLREIYRSPHATEGKRFFLYRNAKFLPRARWRRANGAWNGALISIQNPDLVQIEVPAAARQLELADTFAPGWKAFQNGREIPIQLTSRGFRRLDLARAANEKPQQIRFVFDSQTFRLGLFLSLCALLAVVAGLSGSRNATGHRKTAEKDNRPLS